MSGRTAAVIQGAGILNTGDPREEKIKSWRKIGYRKRKRLLRTVVEYRPCVGTNVNIIMLGNVGSGKSSFVNTISTVFKGRHASRAFTGSAERSLTIKLRSYTVSLPDGGKTCSFKIWDTMGMEENGGLDTDVLPYIFDGNLPSGFDLTRTLEEITADRTFKENPDISDKMHCVCYVVDGTKVDVMSQTSVDQFKEMRNYSRDRGIPIVILVTKIDIVSQLVRDDVKMAYRSSDVLTVVRKVMALFGVEEGMIYLIQNHHQSDPNRGIDVLALTALNKLLNACDDCLESAK